MRPGAAPLVTEHPGRRAGEILELADQMWLVDIASGGCQIGAAADPSACQQRGGAAEAGDARQHLGRNAERAPALALQMAARDAKAAGKIVDPHLAAARRDRPCRALGQVGRIVLGGEAVQMPRDQIGAGVEIAFLRQAAREIAAGPAAMTARRDR